MRHHVAVGSIPDFYPETFQLNRGDPAQKVGPAEPGVLQVSLPPPGWPRHWAVDRPPGARTSFRRAALAGWLTDPADGAGALAARVMVNRLWHHHFGRGLVSTLNDFGFQGDPPTHPELLEHLADDLVRNGWKLKRLHRLMVTSRVYRLSARAGETGRRLDPDNRLWHHRPAPTAGGRGDPRRPPGRGRPARPHDVRPRHARPDDAAPEHLLHGPAEPAGAGAPGVRLAGHPHQRRRPADHGGRPAGAFFLNSPQVLSAAEGLAERLAPALREGPGKAVDLAYRIAFARPATAAEVQEGETFLATGPLEEQARRLRELAHALLGLNEMITIE